MFGVIVLDAGRSRCTNIERDAYILIIALDIVIIIQSSINCATVIYLPTVCYLLREATSEIYGPRVYSLSYLHAMGMGMPMAPQVSIRREPSN